MGMQATYAQLMPVVIEFLGEAQEIRMVIPSNTVRTASNPMTNFDQNHIPGEMGRDLQKAPRPGASSAE